MKNQILKDNNNFNSQNLFIDQLICFYEENDFFKYYRENFSLENSNLLLNLDNVLYNNLILEEIIFEERNFEFSYQNYYFALFHFQKFPLCHNIMRMIQKYVDNLIFLKQSSQSFEFENSFPDKKEISDSLRINLDEINNPKPCGILMIYFLLLYIKRKNKSFMNDQYDLLFLYSLPFQFHTLLFQIYVSNNSLENKIEIILKDEILKLVLEFIPILRNPTFLFTDFKK